MFLCKGVCVYIYIAIWAGSIKFRWSDMEERVGNGGLRRARGYGDSSRPVYTWPSKQLLRTEEKKTVRQRRDLNPQQLILTVLLISDKPQDKTREASKLVSAQTDIPMQVLNNAWLYVSYTLKYLCCSLQSFSGSSSAASQLSADNSSRSYYPNCLKTLSQEYLSKRSENIKVSSHETSYTYDSWNFIWNLIKCHNEVWKILYRESR